MTKATGFMMCVAGVVVFLTCMNPFTYFSIAGVLFASALLGTGIVMWRKGNKGYCEWVSDEEIEGWDWQNTDPVEEHSSESGWEDYKQADHWERDPEFSEFDWNKESDDEIPS